MNRIKTPQEAAMMYLDWGLKNDLEGQWFTANGDNVAWCAAFVLTCCREAGYHLEGKKSDRGRLRSVRDMVKHFKRYQLFSETSLLPGVCHLYSVYREGERYGHVGMLMSLGDDDSLTGWEANVSDKLKLVRRNTNTVTGYMTVPHME